MWPVTPGIWQDKRSATIAGEQPDKLTALVEHLNRNCGLSEPGHRWPVCARFYPRDGVSVCFRRPPLYPDEQHSIGIVGDVHPPVPLEARAREQYAAKCQDKKLYPAAAQVYQSNLLQSEDMLGADTARREMPASAYLLIEEEPNPKHEDTETRKQPKDATSTTLRQQDHCQ
jgi:hypothetical protein